MLSSLLLSNKYMPVRQGLPFLFEKLIGLILIIKYQKKFDHQYLDKCCFLSPIHIHGKKIKEAIKKHIWIVILVFFSCAIRRLMWLIFNNFKLYMHKRLLCFFAINEINTYNTKKKEEKWKERKKNEDEGKQKSTKALHFIILLTAYILI